MRRAAPILGALAAGWAVADGRAGRALSARLTAREAAIRARTERAVLAVEIAEVAVRDVIRLKAEVDQAREAAAAALSLIGPLAELRAAGVYYALAAERGLVDPDGWPAFAAKYGEDARKARAALDFEVS